MSRTRSLSKLIGPSGSQAFDTNTLVIDAANNKVGIGTTAPSSLLTVAGTSDLAWSAATSKLQISRSGAVARLQNYENGSASTNLALQWEGGNVGIGTTSPNSPLEVSNGTENHRVAFNTGEVYLMARNASSYITQKYIANQHVFTGYGDNSSNEAMRIDSSGNVGIGITNPSSYGKLAVKGNVIIDRGSENTAVLLELRTNMAGAITKNTINFKNAALSGTAMASIEQFDNGTETYGALLFKTNNANVLAERMRISSSGGIEHAAPDGQNGEAYRTRYASGSSNIVKVNEAISTGAGGLQDLWFRMIVPQDYYDDSKNSGVLTVSAINLAAHATGSGIFQKVICIGTNHASLYNAAVSTLINSKSGDSYYPWTNTLEFYRNNDQSSDALREVTYIKSRGSNYSNFLLNVEGWIRYGNRLTLTFLGTTAPSNITLVG